MSLPVPEGIQREVLCLPGNGHFVVLGSAGSGKTTLAILRAAYLARTHCNEGEKVLLVTFNKALVTYLRTITSSELKNVEVVNYHKLARGYLNSRGLIRKFNSIVPTMNFNGDNKKLQLIKEAIARVITETGENSTLRRSAEFFYEEISWIQKMGIGEFDSYSSMERVGRGGSRLNKSNRKYVFDVYNKYLEIRNEQNYEYDWDDIAFYVDKELLHEDDTPRRYKHIIIDEGQDFSPIMLKTLVKLIPSEGSLTFFGDVAQQIYGSRLSWRSAGINAPKVWIFDQNFRNSKEIVLLAQAVASLPYFDQDTDLVTPKQPKASGPKPALVRFSNDASEIDWAISRAIDSASTATIAILVRNREAVKLLRDKLNGRGTYFQELSGDMGTWNSEPGITIGTYHSAKGLEFDSVIMPFCNSDTLPDANKLKAVESREDALCEDIKLIYVTITRAKRTLIVTYSGNLTELIPKNNTLYQEFNL